MADALQTYVSVCAGGLVTNVDPLTQSNSLSGSAIRLINMEPSLEGGYRRISGYANSYGTLPGTGKVLGLAVNGEINQGVLGCRKPSSGNNYLHWYNHYYTVVVTDNQSASFTVGETVTAVVSSSDDATSPRGQESGFSLITLFFSELVENGIRRFRITFSGCFKK